MSRRVVELSHACEGLCAVQCIGRARTVPVDVVCLSIVSRTRALPANKLGFRGRLNKMAISVEHGAKRVQVRLSYVTKRVQTAAALVADIRRVTKHTFARRRRAVRSACIGACMGGEPIPAALAN